MGKKILMSCFMTMLLSSAYADDKVAGLIVSTNGSNEEIALSNIANIKFDESQMTVNLKDGSNIAIPFDEVKTMTFAEISAPTSLKQVLGMKRGKITVADIQGRTVWRGKVGDSMPKLKGLYVISDGKKSQKVIINE